MIEYGDKHLKPDHFKSGVSLETSTKCQMYPGSVISWESLFITLIHSRISLNYRKNLTTLTMTLGI